MQVTETLSEGLKRAYTVIVPASDIETKRYARFTNLGKTLALPGFRPGKVPLTLVRQRYGTAVTAEVVEESVSEATRQVLSERGLRPAQQPKVDLISLDVGGSQLIKTLCPSTAGARLPRVLRFPLPERGIRVDPRWCQVHDVRSPDRSVGP